MTPRRSDLVLHDILRALDGIEAAVADRTFEDFCRDWLLRHGVERGIEIISEAARRIPDPLLDVVPDTPWSQIRAIGNILRHEYHRTSDPIVWAVVTEHLPPVRTAVELMLASLDDRADG